MTKSTKKLLLVVALMLLCAGIFIAIFSMMSPDKTQKVKDLEYTVVPERELPETLKSKIEEYGDNTIRISYEEAGYLYLVRGYGTQNSGGYSVLVEELYLTQNALYFKTKLIGPQEEEITPETTSIPYIVVKCELVELPVVFQ